MHFLENSMFVLNVYFCCELRFVATYAPNSNFYSEIQELTQILLRISEEKFGGWSLWAEVFFGFSSKIYSFLVSGSYAILMKCCVVNINYPGGQQSHLVFLGPSWKNVFFPLYFGYVWARKVVYTAHVQAKLWHRKGKNIPFSHSEAPFVHHNLF